MRDQLERRDLKTDPSLAAAAIEYVGTLGVSSQDACNMCSISAKYLGRPVSELAAVVEHVQQRCGGDKALVRQALTENPKILEYDVEPGKSYLVKPHGGRVQLDLLTAHGFDAVRVNYWREGAKFDTAPVAPKTPLP